MLVNIPLNNNIKFNILKKSSFEYKYIIVFNNNTYIKYVLSDSTKIIYLKNINYLTLYLNFYLLNTHLILFLKEPVKSITSYFFYKIKFSGKGFKIKKLIKNNSIKKLFVLYFNKSHLNILYFFSIKLLKLKKTKLVLCSVDNQRSKIIAKNIINIRKINPFTKKGLRLARQLVYKKIGKKSS